jgi:hypothetical protein
MRPNCEPAPQCSFEPPLELSRPATRGVIAILATNGKRRDGVDPTAPLSWL